VHFVTIFLRSLFHTEVFRYIEIILIWVQLVSKPHQFFVNFLASIACIACNNLLINGLGAIHEDKKPLFLLCSLPEDRDFRSLGRFFIGNRYN